MYIEQLYTSCLAEAAYYIESNGEAIVIDPMRDYQPIIDLAAKRKAQIVYILETHFHADFVSGHIDLSCITGAQIVYGPNANPTYTVKIAKDNEIIKLGKISIKVLHTPGHTLESTCYLLLDENGKEHAVFTGDTLFVGDVGRPDLAVNSSLIKEDLAKLLFNSIKNKLLTLPDEVILYPGHGAGSACGKNIGKETVSTIGNQKKFNYALQVKDELEFVNAVTEDLAAAPAYFVHDVSLNKNGYKALNRVIKENLNALCYDDFAKMINDDVIILDTRSSNDFCREFIPKSIYIGLDGQFAMWVGNLIKYTDKLVLITDSGKEEEAVKRLARIGFENVLGYLEGGITTWKLNGQLTDSIQSIESEKLKLDINTKLIDVRNTNEFNLGHVKNALHLPLTTLEQLSNNIDKKANYFVHCAGGYRSLIALSILKRCHVKNVTNILGGFNSIKNNKFVEFAI